MLLGESESEREENAEKEISAKLFPFPSKINSQLGFRISPACKGSGREKKNEQEEQNPGDRSLYMSRKMLTQKIITT